MPASQASTTSDNNGSHSKPFLYIALLLFTVVACAIVVRITSERRNYRRQLARDAAALAQHPSRDVKRPECHEIWLSSASSSSQWQNIRPISAETILPTPSAPVRDKSPSRWSLVKDIHPIRHSPAHQNSSYPSTTSPQPSISQNLRSYEKPAGSDSRMNESHSGLLQVAVLLAMPTPHAPLSGSIPQASLCAEAERLPRGGVVPDVCVGVAHIPFKSEENRTRTGSTSHIAPHYTPTTVRVGRSLLPSVATVRLGHPLNT